MTTVARVGAALTFTVCATMALRAASGPQQTPPVFRGGVQVVTVNARVMDGRGQPIRDLVAADFTVRINGAPQPVVAADFLAVSSDAPRGSSGPGAPGAAGRERTNTGDGTAASVRPRTLVILIDDWSYAFTSGDLSAIRAAARDVLTRVASSDRVGLATTSGVGPQVAPTTDRTAVVTAIAQVSGHRRTETSGDFYFTFEEARAIVTRSDLALAETAANRECRILYIAPKICNQVVPMPALAVMSEVIQRAGQQVRRYAEIAKAVSSLPGPKTIALFSDGLASGFGATPAFDLGLFGRVAAEAGVEVYAMTGVRDDFQAGASHPERARARAREQEEFQNGIENVAGAAGGKVLRLAGDVRGVLDRILTETAGYYQLRVELPLSNRQRFLNAAVSVKRPGASVLAPKQAVSTDVAPEPVSVDQELRSILESGLPAASVPLSIAASIRRSESGRDLELGVNASINAPVPMPLKARFVLVNDIGGSRSGGALPVPDAAISDPRRLTFALNLPPGSYQLRLGVADADGNIGAVSYPVRARLTPTGSWFASDFQLSWADPEGRSRFLALEELPASADSIGVQMELYAASMTAAPPETLVRVELVTLDAKTTLATRDVPVHIENDRARVRGSVPVQTLGPGLYAARAVVIEQGREVGTLLTTFRKVTPAIATPPAAAGASPVVLTAEAVLAAITQEAKDARPSVAIASLLTRPIVQAHVVALAKSSREALPAALTNSASSEPEFWDALATVPQTARAAAPFARGVVALRRGTADVAIALFQRAQSLAPSSISVVAYIGAAYAAAKMLPDAAGAWQLATSDPKIEAEWHVALADALMATNEREAAVALLRDAQARWPEAGPVAARLAQDALAAGDYAGARSQLGRAIGASSLSPPFDEVSAFWSVALAFADALESRTAERVTAFRALAARYLAASPARAALVTRWVELISGR